MRVYPLSDLHLEFQDVTFTVSDGLDYDIVILAGDIDIGTRGLYWAAKTFPALPVIYVPGNHEFYNGHYSKVSIALKEVAKELGIHLLDNSSVVIDGIRFVGATLWTDFRLYGNDMATIGNCLHTAKNYITDFSVIRFGSTGWMTPSDSVKLFLVSAKFIEDELNKPFTGKSVVVTHHLPSMKCVAEKYKRDLTSAAFASTLDRLVKKADLWIAGHTHVSFDVNVNDETVQVGWICGRCSEGGKMLTRSRTWHDGHCHFCGRDNVGVTSSEDFYLPPRPGKGRVIVNPRGYEMYGEIENRQFQPDLVVEI